MSTSAVSSIRRADTTPLPEVRAFDSRRLDAVIAGLRKAWAWIQERRVVQLRSRRLSVAETVSLGEKRFVAILKVDGEQFLIGGSATGVSMLATLKAEQASPGFQKLLDSEISKTRGQA